MAVHFSRPSSLESIAFPPVEKRNLAGVELEREGCIRLSDARSDLRRQAEIPWYFEVSFKNWINVDTLKRREEVVLR